MCYVFGTKIKYAVLKRSVCPRSLVLHARPVWTLRTHDSPVGKHGIQLQPGLVELFLLLFADDLALLSSTAMGLQNQLNHLNSMCKEHSLSINSEKSKVMVFRKKVDFSAKMKSGF